MITVRAGSAAIGLCWVLLAAGCSREQQDWRSAEAADTIDSYGRFIQRHPESELVTQARTRLAQLGEDRDWERAGSADTVDAYREFIAQHPSGKWAQEANIRIQNFSLGEQTGTDAATQVAATASSNQTKSAANAASRSGPAQPGDSATPSGPTPAASGTVQPVSPLATPATAKTTLKVPGAPATAKPSHASPSASAIAKSATPAEAPRAATSPGPGGHRDFGIQLGAFSSEAGASAQWGTLSSKYAPQLRGLQQHIVPADTASGRVYRLQATVGDEGRARTICDQLRQHGQACVAVLPH